MGNKDAMVAKLGSEEAYKEFMRQNARKSNKPGQQSGFAKLKETNPELHRELSSKGGKKSHRTTTTGLQT